MNSYPKLPLHGYATDNTGWLQYCCDHKDAKMMVYKTSRYTSQC